MPELRWYFGYPLCIALMIVISAAQFYFFYRKGWIFGGKWDGPVLPSDSTGHKPHSLT
jgi:hypothetical protein